MTQLALLDPVLPAGPLAVPAPPTPARPVAPGAPSPTRRIVLAPYDLGCALAHERELGVSHVLAQVLVRRGMRDAAAARAWLDPCERHDPLKLGGIERAVAAVERHVAQRSNIVVHGDYDVDGVCATAVMVRALRSLGADPSWYIPSRADDGYGLSEVTIKRLAARGTALLITVDCGITATNEVALARAAGIEVIVTDHHAPSARNGLPDCHVVHPLLGGYPTPDLCGTAVAHKLAEALAAPSAAEDLELVALATVADLVPLRGENRRLVREGLAQLSGTARPGLRALMEVAKVDPSALDAACLGFRLAPRLNASGRLRRADAALELLLTDDPARAAQVARELDRVNAERRAVEERIGWQAEEQVQQLGDRCAYVLAAEGWHPGVIGIVASRIVERHHRPAILIARQGTAPAQGSGRSIPGFDLLATLDAVADHLLRYGGHRAAAGLTILPERIDDLREAVETHAEAVLTPDLLESVERVDAVVSGSELTLGLAEELLALEPCGIGNPSVNLLLSGARFDSVRPLGDGRHARFSVVSGGARAAAIAFGCDGVVPGDDGREPLDASFRLDRNVWRGIVEPRLVFRHAAACAPAPIEVVGEPVDYLAAAFAELDRRPAPPGADAGANDSDQVGSARRRVLDRRGESPLAVLADARAVGGRVLAVCAEVSRRLPGLAARAGGFALVAHSKLAAAPELAAAYAQLVVLDPPATDRADAATRGGSGYTHLAWGEAELRFARQMHEQEYGLRASLVALYRALQGQGRVTGDRLVRLLRDDSHPPGPQRHHPRPAHQAGRLVRILAELELVSLDRTPPALALVGAAPTELERSPAFRAYVREYEEGQRFLSRAQPRSS